MIKMAKDVFLLAAALSTGWACSSAQTPVDIGDGRTGERLADYAAQWEGYAEAYNFADGSDKVKLSLDSSGNGTLSIGDSPALPIATDPDVGYPVSVDSSFYQFTGLFPGFAYAVDTATVESKRIRFTVNPWQVERDWCELQTTTYDAWGSGSGGSGGASSGGGSSGSGGFAGDVVPPGYAVGPDSGGFGLSRYRCVADTRTPANADKYWLCWRGVCSCDAQSCTNYVPPSGARATRAQLDAALDNGGNSLVGTLRVGSGGQIAMTVRLQRVQHD